MEEPTGDVTNIDAKIQRLQDSIKHISPEDPAHDAKLCHLGLAYRDRHQVTGSITDINNAIEYLQASVNSTPQEHPDLARRLHDLGFAYGLRCKRVTDIKDADAAIEHAEESVKITPSHDPDRAERLDTLGTAYSTRHDITGSTADREASVDYQRQALTCTPSDHPDYARRLNVIGIGYDNRHHVTGNTEDINVAIEYMRRSVDRTSQNHLERGRRLHSLGIAYSHRYDSIQDATDLDQAIRCIQESVDLVPSHHPEYARRLDSLGIMYISRYKRTSNIADLDTAVEHFSRSVALTPLDHSNRARRLHSLGIGYHYRFAKNKNPTDMDISIQHLEESVEHTSTDQTERAEHLGGLGTAYHERFVSSKNTIDLDMAIKRLAEAVRATASPVQTRLEYAVKSLLACGGSKRFKEAYDTIRVAMPLVPLSTPRFLNSADKQHLLAKLAGFASDSAAVALHEAEDAFEALQYLELGRGVISGSLIEMRMDVTTLSSAHPELGQEFTRLSNLLDPSGGAEKNGAPAPEDNQSDLRYDAQKEMETLLSDIRSRQGFEGFLLVPKQEDIKSAAESGAIAVVNVSWYRCDAILVEPSGIRFIPLPKLDGETIKSKADQGNLGSPETLSWMWDTIANPILEALGFTTASLDNHWPHLWWIPTGLLTRFPLHAAGRHQEKCSKTVLDRAMSSYSSSIKAIIHGRTTRHSEASQAASQALLVAAPNTSEDGPLPFAVEEVRMVKQVCESMAITPIEPGGQKSDITPYLQQCRMFHFAGHGSASNNPLQSCLLLEGEGPNLTVADIQEISIRDHLPFLAYLSACGTGRARDDRLLDESVHLISAFQLAGFRHVIGTLWEVQDDVCVDIARYTYEGIKHGGMTDASVCQGLHDAGRRLRDMWLSGESSNSRRGARDRDAGHAAHRPVQSERDAGPLEDDDEEEERSLSWVPYVHYGV